MKPALPVAQGMDTHRFGLAVLLLALLMPASVWLVAYSQTAPRSGDDSRRLQFIRSAAGVEDGLRLMRALEKHVVASGTSSQKSTYYNTRYDSARARVAKLDADARALAADAGERARIERLAVLVRTGDARHARVLAAARAGRQPWAMAEAKDGVVSASR